MRTPPVEASHAVVRPSAAGDGVLGEVPPAGEGFPRVEDLGPRSAAGAEEPPRRVAMPLRWVRKLRAVRSAVRSEAIGPVVFEDDGPAVEAFAIGDEAGHAAGRIDGQEDLLGDGASRRGFRANGPRPGLRPAAKRAVDERPRGEVARGGEILMEGEFQEGFRRSPGRRR